MCDGHGHNGQDVSGLLKQRLPANIEQGLKKELKQQDKDQQPEQDLMHQILTKAFSETNREVYNSGIDVRFSGSTCVSVLTYGRRLYVANVGDSRACLVKANSATDTSAQV